MTRVLALAVIVAGALALVALATHRPPPLVAPSWPPAPVEVAP